MPLHEYTINLLDKSQDMTRVQTLSASDVFDAHKQSYFDVANITETVDRIFDSNGVELYNDEQGFLQE